MDRIRARRVIGAPLRQLDAARGEKRPHAVIAGLAVDVFVVVAEQIEGCKRFAAALRTPSQVVVGHRDVVVPDKVFVLIVIPSKAYKSREELPNVVAARVEERMKIAQQEFGNDVHLAVLELDHRNSIRRHQLAKAAQHHVLGTFDI